MPTLIKTSGRVMPYKQNGKLIMPLVVLLITCFFSRAGEAQYGGGSGTTASAETNTYVFLLSQSTVVQTGGIAGVHWTYSVEGLFQLTVDPDAGTASFAHVDANATDDSPLRRTLDPNEVFNMTSLLGTFLDDTTISFTGKAADGSDVLITLTIEDDLAYLVGQTIPPPNTADFFLFSLDAVAQRKYGGGTGEPNDPYLIYTAEQMNAIEAEPNDWDKHFKLMADIDLSGFTGTDFNIIGYFRGAFWPEAFTGVFDGNGKKIYNFSYTSTDRDIIGLFRYVDGENAQIKDLGLIDPNVAGTEDVGSLVGDFWSGTITGCYVNGGSVSGGGYVGGLAGASSGTITNCTSSASVSGNDYVGGLVGGNNGTITNCYANATVTGGDNVGGLVGVNVNGYIIPSLGGLTPFSYGTITNCYSLGHVTGGWRVGGLVGENRGEVTDSFWDTKTSGQVTSDGGTGKTTAEMQMASTFTDAGWDFVGESVNGTEDIWSICEGTNYPRLAWQIPAGDFICPDGITIEDFVFFAEYWRDDNCDISNDYCQGTDLDFSGTVDADDLEILLENWLAGVRSD
jgi:hypothetical protein